jgi:2-keto-4-pentenoate hydratase
VGSIGFSAGAEINLVLSVRGADRQYARIDAADDPSSRPDFNIAIYGGGFADVRANELRPDIASRINAETPPMFIAHAFDDQALSSVILMNALKQADVVSELHIFGAGAHGFGVRDSGLPVAAWRELCLRWLAWQGFMDKAFVREYATQVLRARQEKGAAYPRFTVSHPSATLSDAYAVQRRVIEANVRSGDRVVGYAASVAASGKPALPGDTEWMHAVLLKSGRLDADNPVIVGESARRPLIKMGIGYVIAVDIGTKLRVPRQAATSVEAIVPAIELRRPLEDALAGAAPEDQVAVNLGIDRFLLGTPVSPSADGEIDVVDAQLKREGKVLQSPAKSEMKEARALSLMRVMNQIIDQGHVLHRGDVIILGPGNATAIAESGGYVADYGRWGKIEFRIE